MLKLPAYNAPVKTLGTARSQKTLKISNKKTVQILLDIWIYEGRSAAFIPFFHIAPKASLSINTSLGLEESHKICN